MPKKIYVCFSENATISYDLGTKYICDPGDGKDRTFYVLDSSKDTVSLIMDRNIGGVVLYTSLEDYIQSGGSEAEFTPNGNNSLGPITAKKYLNKVTSNWKDVSVSLPTYKQLFNADSKNIWVYGNLWCSVGLCTEKVENDTAEKGYVYGYWLSDSCSETYHDRAYAMVEAGAGYGVFICTTVGTNSGDYLSLTGVRPVITILKVDIS